MLRAKSSMTSSINSSFIHAFARLRISNCFGIWSCSSLQSSSDMHLLGMMRICGSADCTTASLHTKATRVKLVLISDLLRGIVRDFPVRLRMRASHTKCPPLPWIYKGMQVSSKFTVMTGEDGAQDRQRALLQDHTAATSNRSHRGGKFQKVGAEKWYTHFAKALGNTHGGPDFGTRKWYPFFSDLPLSAIWV